MTYTRPAPRRRIAGSAAATAAIAVALLMTLAPPAPAGSYTVAGSCGWRAWGGSAFIRVYASPHPEHSCPALSVAALAASPAGAFGGWVFHAPPGTSITSGTFLAWADAREGWQASIARQGGSASGSSWLNCPGGTGCQANPGNQWVSGPAYNASAVVARLICNRAPNCTRLASLQIAGNASVALHDYVLPRVVLLGGPAAGKWTAGTPPVVIDSTDNTGIRSTRLLIDGGRQRAYDHPCDYRRPVPCANRRTSLTAPTTIFPDGRHTLTAEAIDAAGNRNAASRELLIDNTPPATPQRAAIAGGTGWRAQATRRVTWVNPPQRFASITAARYSLCPAEAISSSSAVAGEAKAECVSGEHRDVAVSEIPEIKLPRPGLWTLRVWLVDAAGNVDPDSAATINGLGYDPTPPEVSGFADQDPADPARVVVRASEDISPLAGGSIEIQRRGTASWRPLSTQLRASGISAFVDDERLRTGRYVLRATVTNAAGLQQGTASGGRVGRSGVGARFGR